MSHATEPTAHPAVHVEPPTKRRGLLQLRLRTLFLLTAAVGVWVAVFSHRQRNQFLNQRIAAMRPVARELMVLDPSQIAVVNKEQLWYDENRWEVYLPEGTNYRICLATREIDQQGLAPVVTSAPLAAGKHLLELHQERRDEDWTLRLTGDDANLLAVDEPKAWNPGHGSSGGAAFSQSTQMPADQPAVLFRRRFSQSTGTGGSSQTPTGPTDGILIWTERADDGTE